MVPRPRIAVLGGDGIGPEVTAEVVGLVKALRTAGRFDAELVELDWGAERYLATGVAVPPGGFDQLRECDAIFVGAFGDPRIPDSEHARRILLGMRTELDLFINLRPARCLDARLNPLRDVPADKIDMVVVRENTEGLYAGAGGVLHRGGAQEVAVQEMIVSRHGVERIIRAAFGYAATQGRRKVTLVDKANALRWVGELWQRAFAVVAAEHPDIAHDHLYVDAAVLRMVRDPGTLDVIVTGNLFGDILSDLAGALQGGLGMSASANLHPGRVSMFEPVHGSAPDIAGRGVANPIGALASFGLMARFLGHERLAASVEGAISEVARTGELTPDAGGRGTTREVGAAIRDRVMESMAR